MNSSVRPFHGGKFLVGIAAFFIIVAGLRAAQGILIPFMFAIFLAIIGSPAVLALKRLRIPTFLSITIVTVIIVGVLVAAAAILGTSVNAFTSQMPEYREQFNNLTKSIDDQLKQSAALETGVRTLIGSFNPSTIFEMVGRLLKGLLAALQGAFLMIVIMIFVMFEAAEFQKKMFAALGSAVDMVRIGGITKDVQRYLAIKTATSGVTGLLVFLWVTVMDVEFPALWGLIAFLMNYIPYIGSMLAAVPAILLALVLLGGTSAAGLAVGYVVINVGVSNFLEPVLMGRRLGLSPLVVFLSLVFWGYVWGPAGMLISVPLTMLVVILLEHSDDLNWIAVLLGSKPPRTEPPEITAT